MAETSTLLNPRDRPLKQHVQAAAEEGQRAYVKSCLDKVSVQPVVSCKATLAPADGTCFVYWTKMLCPIRLSPSDGDSLGSEQSSGRESAEESTRPVATPSDGKHHRKMPKNGEPW